MPMKLMLLLALAVLASAADYVELTLKDGRKLAGYYDVDTGVLDMGVGKITVKREEIKEELITHAPVKEAKKTKSSDGVVGDFQQKMAAIDEQRRATIAEFKKALYPVIMSMDLRLVDTRGRNDNSTQESIRDLNGKITALREYVDQVRVDEFMRTTPQEYQRMNARRSRGADDDDGGFLHSVSIITDPLLSAAYTASRSRPLVTGATKDPVEIERQRFTEWKADNRRRMEEEARARRSQRDSDRSGGTINLGQPKSVDR